MSLKTSKKRCIFPFCQIVGTTRFYKFPINNKKRLDLWLEVCNLTSVKPNDSICYRHFDQIYLLNGPNRNILRQDAVPRWYTVSFLD